MKTLFSKSSILFFMAFIIATGCSKTTKPREMGNIGEFQSNFANPPSEYRSAPLWDWNEQISEEGIDFQMKEFKKAGIGGVFVHPRPGLLTEYLSEEWFHLFDYTVQKGKELDMKVWIYDENSYPSGFAGGHVPAEMPDSYQHGSSLRMYVQNTVDVTPSDDLEVVLKKQNEGFADITNQLEDEKGKTGRYYIFEKAYPGKSPWYGGFSYVDLLYPGVTDKFIELTMTKGYAKKNKADFGNTLPGIFSDEPNLEAAMARGAVIRWTPDLWEAFQQRWGYNLKVNLPSLLEEVGDWKKVRHDYYELILELFLDRWAKPYSNYCDENNLNWTGHYWEHGWPEPTHGFDESSFYIWHQMPGVDMLGNKLDTAGLGGQFGNDRAVRELRSAANQAGRKRTLSETYGGAGWELNFEEQKRLVDWECVLGVNFVNQHLSYYSLNGVRKFDYPPSFSYHEPWWEDYKLMGDYIGRVSMAMATGEQINKTLVLQPTTTAWMYFSRKEKNPKINEIRNGFKNFVYRLEQQHVEYDLGSENVIKTLGSVNGNQLTVGQRNYSLVVIPAEMENINKSTLKILTEYLKNGGKVLAFNSTISRIDGGKSEALKQLVDKYQKQWTNVNKPENTEALAMLNHSDFKMTDKTQNGMLYHQRRILDDGQLLFVVNSHKKKEAIAEVAVRGKYVMLFDLVSGKEYNYPAELKNGMLTFPVQLSPAGSALFVISNKKLNGLNEFKPIKTQKRIAAKEKVSVKRESDNILVVNYLDLKTKNSYKKDTYFMDALIGLFIENGIKLGNPWQHKIQYKKNYLELDSLFTEESGFDVDYNFEINDNLSERSMKTIRAVVERPELWQVSINGQKVSPLQDEYWIEKDFPVFKVGQFLKKGKNKLTLKAPRMHILAETMPVYLLGDFLVTPGLKGFEISEGNINEMGSWQKLGLPFYSQKVAYSQKFNINKKAGYRYNVQLKQWNGSVADIFVNGKAAGLIAWQPNSLDVTQFLNEGENEITVKVIGSLKNTFGFFYHDNTAWIHGPHSWNSAPKKIPSAKEYFLMDYGLFEPFELMEVK